jgi:hypothetical protein
VGIKIEPACEDAQMKQEDDVSPPPKRRGRPKKDLITHLASANFVFENTIVP